MQRIEGVVNRYPENRCQPPKDSSEALKRLSDPHFQQIEDHPPPPIRTVHVAQRGGGFVCILLGPYAMFSVEIP